MSKMISVGSGFQYSVNISYDLHNDEKLMNFIPTKAFLQLLESIIDSTASDSTERARVLIGAYGKGKSHIILAILAMLMKRDLSLFEKLLPILKKNGALYKKVLNYYDSDNKILPIIVSGSNASLSQGLLIALQHTLAENDLSDIMPETNYKAAIDAIRRWQEEYFDTFERFASIIDEPVETFVERLANYDLSAYLQFEDIYPKLTAGSHFNPFLGFDVVDLYENVAQALKASGKFSGIYVIYDEFSKFLEANIKHASVSDTKMLQDLAEKCNRSGETQMHVMMISHKEIINYIDQLPKQKVDGWRGVSERFLHVRLNNNFSQTYEIIGTVIQKEENSWQQFCKKHSEAFDHLSRRYNNHAMFSNANDLNQIYFECYPLHPVSTFILPRLSERIAQNERTLFTFLSANGRSTLLSYLNEYDDLEFHLLTPDYIYDYFEPLFKKEIYNSELHHTFVLADIILEQIDKDSLEAKIIKTLALIYILQQFEKIKPTKEEIIGIFSVDHSISDIEKALESLIEKELVIYLKRSNHFLQLKQSSGVDIKQKINDTIAAQESRLSVKEILNHINFDRYMYPSRYNDKKEMVRYFTFSFINEDEIDGVKDWDIKGRSVVSGAYSDGYIYGVIPNENTVISELKEKIKAASENAERHIFIILKYDVQIDAFVREFSAVSLLKDQAIGNKTLYEEYEVIYQDLHDIILSFIKGYTRPEYNNAYYYWNGEERKIYRRSTLSDLLSYICDRVYPNTPTINNEALNRNVITKMAEKSRNKVITGLLRKELEHNLGLIGNGQEISIMRNILINKGILVQDTDTVKINLNVGDIDPNLENTLKVIEDFIQEAKVKRKLTFDSLYERLESPQNGIGLRKGLIPLFLAVLFHENRQDIIISDRYGQIPVNVDTIMSINAEPENYTLSCFDWDEEKAAFVAALSKLFGSSEKKDINNVASEMYRWYMSLPRFAKENRKSAAGEKLEKKLLAFLQLLKKNLGGYELIFEKLPKIFGKATVDAAVAQEVSEIKYYYDRCITQLKEYLISRLNDIFSDGFVSDSKKHSFYETINKWLLNLDQNIYEQLFSDGLDIWIDLCQNHAFDEDEFIQTATYKLMGLHIEDWNDFIPDQFIEKVKGYKIEAEEFKSVNDSNIDVEVDGYQIVFADENGNKDIKQFDRVETGKFGPHLYNSITDALDSMGQAMTRSQKRQILIDVLKELC